MVSGVNVAIRITLAEGLKMDPQKLATFLDELREAGAEVVVEGPSPDEVARVLQVMHAQLDAARVRFKGATAEIDALSNRIAELEGLNRWRRRAAEAG